MIVLLFYCQHRLFLDFLGHFSISRDIRVEKPFHVSKDLKNNQNRLKFDISNVSTNLKSTSHKKVKLQKLLKRLCRSFGFVEYRTVIDSVGVFSNDLITHIERFLVFLSFVDFWICATLCSFFLQIESKPENCLLTFWVAFCT